MVDENGDLFDLSNDVQDAIESGTITYLSGIATAKDYEKEDEDEEFENYLQQLFVNFIDKLQRDIAQLNELIAESEEQVELLTQQIQENQETISTYQDVQRNIRTQVGVYGSNTTYSDMLERLHGEQFIHIEDGDQSVILTDDDNNQVYIDEHNQLYHIDNDGNRIAYNLGESAALFRRALLENKVFANYTTASKDATNHTTARYYIEHKDQQDSTTLSPNIADEIEKHLEEGRLSHQKLNGTSTKLKDILESLSGNINDIESIQHALSEQLERESEKLETFQNARDQKSELLTSLTQTGATPIAQQLNEAIKLDQNIDDQLNAFIGTQAKLQEIKEASAEIQTPNVTNALQQGIIVDNSYSRSGW